MTNPFNNFSPETKNFFLFLYAILRLAACAVCGYNIVMLFFKMMSNGNLNDFIKMLIFFAAVVLIDRSNKYCLK